MVDHDQDTIQAFIEQVHSSEDFSDLWEVMLRFCENRGIARFSYHHLPPPGAPDFRSGEIFTEGFPKEWVRHYVRDNLDEVDPIPTFARTQVMPFRWQEIQSLTTLTGAQKEFLKELSSTGIGDGLAVSVFGPAGRNGYMGLGFKGDPPPPRLNDHCLRELQWACQLVHFKYCELLNPIELELPVLSPREQEVLQWVARGKSNSVISDIMGISPHTVDTHLRRVFQKLKVNDRTTAAIRAVGTGLIS